MEAMKPVIYIHEGEFLLAVEQIMVVAARATDEVGLLCGIRPQDPQALVDAVASAMGEWAGVEFRLRRD